jgi:cytochrome oxidase Cu insertion factor (SCO1/SenC/PrrC family)
MRRRWRWIGIAALLLVAGGAGAWQWNERRAAPAPAPRFNLMASNGNVVTLDDFLGKQEVVLIFYMGAG